MSDWRAARDAAPVPDEPPARPERDDPPDERAERFRALAERHGLPAIVEEAYGLFAPYRATPPLHVCQCDLCLPLDRQQRMLAGGPRTVSEADLGEWDSSVIVGTLDGDGIHDAPEMDETRHLLPRMLEIMAEGGCPSQLGIENALRALPRARWHTWPAPERDLVDRFLDAYWRVALDRIEPSRAPIGAVLDSATDAADVLAMIVVASTVAPDPQAGDADPREPSAAVERALATWDAWPDPAGAVHLAEARRDLVRREADWLFSSVWFEPHHLPAARRIGAWLASDAATHRLERAFFALSGGGPDEPEGAEALREIISRGHELVWPDGFREE